MAARLILGLGQYAVQEDSNVGFDPPRPRSRRGSPSASHDPAYAAQALCPPRPLLTGPAPSGRAKTMAAKRCVGPAQSPGGRSEAEQRRRRLTAADRCGLPRIRLSPCSGCAPSLLPFGRRVGDEGRDGRHWPRRFEPDRPRTGTRTGKTSQPRTLIPAFSGREKGTRGNGRAIRALCHARVPRRVKTLR
jgi:hypothetical protein